MPFPWEYENDATYTERQSRIEQQGLRLDFAGQLAGQLGDRISQMGSGFKRSLTEYGGAARLSQLGDIAGAGVRGIPEILEPLRQTPSPGGALGSLGRGFERASRIGALTRESIGRAGNLEPGLTEQIMGGTAPEGIGSFSGSNGLIERLLHTGSLDLPIAVPFAPQQLRTTLPVRDVAGFAGDVTLDPLNLIPGPNVPGLLGRGARAAIPAARPALKAIRNITLDDVLARQGSGLAQRVQQASNLPGVGGAIERAGNLISPRLMNQVAGADELPRINNGLQEVMGNIPNVQRRLLAPIKAAGLGRTAPVDESGVMRLLDGSEFAANDAWSMPRQLFLKNKLDPHTAHAAETAHAMYDQVIGQAGEIYDRLNTKYPGVARNFAGIFDLADMPAEHEHFVPRYTRMPDGQLKKNWTVKPGTRRTADMERDYLTSQEKIAAGKQDLPPLENFAHRFYELHEAMANMQAAEKLADYATANGGHVFDPTALEAAGRELGAAVADQNKIVAVRGMLAQVERGLTPRPEQLEKLRADFPSIISEVEGAMSRKTSPLSTGFPGVRGETQLPSPLTPEARDLLNTVNAGGVPAIVTSNLARIAKEQGIRVTNRTTPNEIVAALRQKKAVYDAAFRAAPEGVERMPPTKLGLDPEREYRSPVLTPELRRIQQGVNKMLEGASERTEGARYQRRWFEAEESAPRGPHGEELAQPDVGRFKGIWLSPEEAKSVAESYTKFATPLGERLLGRAESVTDIMRTAMTTMDLSAALIQGIPHLARHPGQFLQSFSYMVGSALDKEGLNKLMATPQAQAVSADLPEIVMGSGTNEYMQGAGAIERFGERIASVGASLPGPLGKVGALPGKAVSELTERSQLAFDTFGTAARIFWGDALRARAVADGSQHEVAAMINHATGVLGTPRGMGLSPTQRAIESTIFFAPNYFRSAVALMGDIVQGGVAGDEARQTLRSMLIAGAVWYPALARAMDQKPVLDPADSRFMTVNINGVRIGIGTPWLGMARALARSAADPASLTKADDKNPLISYVRGRLSPGLGFLADAMSGETIDKQPVDSIQDVLKLGGKRFLPMVMQSVAEDVFAGRNPATSALGQAFGAREFPQGRLDVREQLAKEKYGRGYAELDPYQEVAVQTDPRMTQLGIVPGKSGDRQRREAAIYDEYGQGVAQLAQAVQNHQLTKDQFRNRVNEATAKRNARLGDMPVEEVRPGRTELTANQKAYQGFIDQIKQQDQFGRRDPTAIDEYVAALPKEQQAYIKAKQDAAIGRLPPEAQGLVREMRQAQATLEPYFDLRERAFKAAGLNYETYLRADPATQEAIRQSRPGQRAAATEDRLKLAYRRSHRDVDRALVEWHGDQPLNVVQARSGPSYSARQSAAFLAPQGGIGRYGTTYGAGAGAAPPA